MTTNRPNRINFLSRLIIAALVMFSIVAPGSGGKANKTSVQSKSGGRIVVGYYFNSGNGYDVSHIAYENITCVSHAFAIPNSDGTLNIDDIRSQIANVSRTVHQNKKKAILSVGGWNGSTNFSGIAADPGKRHLFESALRTFCVSNEYDGIDIDWEYPMLEERPAVTRFIRELSDTLRRGNTHFTLSIAMPPAISERGYAVADLEPYLDWIGVMTYDYATCVSLTADDNAPLLQSQSDITVLLRSVPAAKLLFGIPFYGRQYHCPSGAGLGARTDSCMEMPFATIPGVSQGGWQSRWDTTSSVPYLVNQTTNHLITYDDERSIQAKCQWLKKKNLGGVIIWALGQDRSDSLQPLLRLVGRELLGEEERKIKKN